MAKHHFRIIQGCPCPQDIAPFIVLVLQGATVNSIYRGQDAEPLLNKYGHQSQAQLYYGYTHGLPGYNPANPPGYSTHELKSDGAAYPNVPRGHDLPWWGQGFDVNDSEVEDVEHQARLRGWELFRPYDSGSEYHHLNFKVAPGPSPSSAKIKITEKRIKEVRNRLPRS